MLLFVTEHNLRCDARVQHITGKNPIPRHWFIWEALQSDMKQLTRTVFDDGIQYPPEIDLTKHMEPVGEAYQFFDEWERYDAAILELYYQAGGDPANITTFLDSTISTTDEAMEDLMGGIDDADLPLTDDSPIPSPTRHITAGSDTKSPAQPPPTPEPPIQQPAQQPVQQSTPPAVARLPPVEPMDQATFSARLLQLDKERASPARKRSRQENTNQPNMYRVEGWGIRKSGFDNKTVTAHWIHSLTSIQKHHLLRAYHQVVSVCGPRVPSDFLTQQMANVFNQWHTDKLKLGIQGGLGGYIPIKQVKSFLQEMGHGVVQQQLQHRMQNLRDVAPTIYNPPPQLPRSESLQPLTVDQVNRMKTLECRATLRALGRSQQGNLSAMQRKIKEAYGMPLH